MNKIGFIFLFLFSAFLAGAQLGIQFKITVAQDGTGDFETIQAAIDATKAFPPERITIVIKNGVYREKVTVPSWNNKLSIIGEDRDKTIIVWDDYFKKIDRGRNSTFFTYTLKVEADDFYAENLTIENLAGPVGQAVALHVEGNRCKFKNCKLLGNQDTAYLDGENSNQLFENCSIAGTTDFIFGSATVVFKGCTLVSRSNSYITAASTTNDKPFGFVFLNCRLVAEKGVDNVYLGRPWRPYAKTVFINCFMDKHICNDGWKEWSNKEDKTTTFYAEYNSSGPGANTNRVEWAHQLPAKKVSEYTIKKILGEWTTTINE
ncbi:pectinesterase family protein [uncultured Draconibacterium sp.]|uniref:pectinesterase family protein n=1 Tax=uncultured Draconibacterium sp. TaxID=1573823 RepID=UPI002AA7A533|nr:pectinesterase family protein [uncultured Draconibacterium sp.]